MLNEINLMLEPSIVKIQQVLGGKSSSRGRKKDQHSGGGLMNKKDMECVVIE
jgi:hypothetical protein